MMSVLSQPAADEDDGEAEQPGRGGRAQGLEARLRRRLLDGQGQVRAAALARAVGHLEVVEDR